MTRSGLGQQAVRGGLVTLGGQWLRYAIQIAGMLVLARLLTPSDFGVFAMVAAVVGLGEVVRDAGLSNGAIRARTLTQAQQSTLFYVNVGVGVLMGAVIAASGPLLVRFFDEPRLADLALVLALVPVFGGLAAQYVVDLARAMKFTAVASAEAGGMLIGTGVAIAMAALGAGVWALAGLQLTQTAARLAIAWRASAFRVARPAPLSEVSRILRFGLDLLGVQLLDFASRNADNLIIGRTAGAAALGYYTRAYQLLLLPLQQVQAPLTRVALPVLSRLKDDVDALVRYLLSATTVLAYFGCFTLAACAVFAEELVRVALGSQWSASAELLRALAVAGMFQSCGYVSYWIFMALDRTRANLRYALIAKPMVIAGFVVGAHWGALGVALAYSAVSAVIAPLSILMACRDSAISARQLLWTTARPLLVGLACLAAGLLIRYPADIPEAEWLAASILAAGAMVVYLCRVSYLEDADTLRNVRQKVRRPAASTGLDL